MKIQLKLRKHSYSRKLILIAVDKNRKQKNTLQTFQDKSFVYEIFITRMQFQMNILFPVLDISFSRESLEGAAKSRRLPRSLHLD